MSQRSLLRSNTQQLFRDLIVSIPVSLLFFSHNLNLQSYTTLGPLAHHVPIHFTPPVWLNQDVAEHIYLWAFILHWQLFGCYSIWYLTFLFYYSGPWLGRTVMQDLNWPFITWFCGAFFDGGTETLPQVNDSAPFIVQRWFYCPLSMFPAMQYGGRRCGSHIVTILVVCRDTSRMKLQYGMKLWLLLLSLPVFSWATLSWYVDFFNFICFSNC